MWRVAEPVRAWRSFNFLNNPLDRLERSAWTPGDCLHRGSCDKRHDLLSGNYVENPRSLTHWVTQIIIWGSLRIKRSRRVHLPAGRQAGNPWCCGIRKLFCLALFRCSWLLTSWSNRNFPRKATMDVSIFFTQIFLFVSVLCFNVKTLQRSNLRWPNWPPISISCFPRRTCFYRHGKWNLKRDWNDAIIVLYAFCSGHVLVFIMIS